VNLTRLLWAVAVVLAMVVAGMVYVDGRGDEPTLTVMVAKQVIPAGTYVKGGTFDFVKVSHDQNQTRYTIGAEPFINRFIQPRIQYRINNGPPQPGENPNELVDNQDELIFELHFFF